MSQSKKGDWYNYEAITYLSLKPTRLFENNSQSLVINIMPNLIKESYSFFKKPISFDGILNGTNKIFYCECKYTELIKGMTQNSTEFKNALVEFIGAELYRNILMEKDLIRYLFISNCPVDNLRKNHFELIKYSNGEINEYINKLRYVASQKWNLDEESIHIEGKWLREVLTRLDIIQVSDSDIASIRNSELFKEKLFELTLNIPLNKKDNNLNDLLSDLNLIENNEINIILNRTNLPYESHDINKYIIKIPYLLIKHINDNSPKNNFVAKKVNTYSEIIYDISFQMKKNMSRKNAIKLLIKKINDLIEDNLIIVFDENLLSFYYFNVQKTYKIIMQSINNFGRYSSSKINVLISLELSDIIVENLVSETMRKYLNYDVRSDMIDFS